MKLSRKDWRMIDAAVYFSCIESRNVRKVEFNSFNHHERIQKILSKSPLSFSFNPDSVSSFPKLLTKSESDNINWETAAFSYRLTEDDIKKYEDKLDWKQISCFQNLSIPFMEEFFDKLNKTYIIVCQELDEEFIRNHQSSLDWTLISMYQKLSEEFIEEFKDKVDWDEIKIYQVL